MRLSALASVLLLGTLAAGCVDQRTHVYSGSYCDEYECGPSIAPAAPSPAYGGGHRYGGYPRFRDGGYQGGRYDAPPPPVGYNPARCAEC